jgi:hypothetical protein
MLTLEQILLDHIAPCSPLYERHVSLKPLRCCPNHAAAAAGALQEAQ